MHRTLERLDGAASTIVPLAYLAGMMLGTAAYFSGVVLDAGLAVGLALAVAVELHGFLEQRRVRALWAGYHRAQDLEQRERLSAELRAHLLILAGLVLFQAYNSLQFLSATWHPVASIVPVPVQLLLRALILPAGFLLSGALSPLTIDAGEELRRASRHMLRRTLRATLRQWNRRIDRAQKSGHDLAPVAVALMEDAGDTDGARRIRLIAAGLDTADGHTGRANLPAIPAESSLASLPASQGHSDVPPRPPAGPGSPSIVQRRQDVSQRAPERPAVLRLTPARGDRRAAAHAAAKGTHPHRVRTATVERQVRAAYVPGMTVGKLQRAAGVSRSAAGKWRKVLLAESAQEVAQ